MEKQTYKFKSLEEVKLHPIVKRFWMISFFILLFIVGILFLPWQQTVKGVGTVIAYNPTERNYNILSPISGFIENFYVQEDQFVKKGTLLFSMVDLDKKYLDRIKRMRENTEIQLKNVRKEIKILLGRMENLKENLNTGIDIYNGKLNQIKEKIKSLELKKVALQKNYEITKSNYERIKALYEEGIESKRKFEIADNKFTKARIELNKIKLDIKIEKQNFEITKNEKNKFVQDMENKIKSLQNSIISSRNKIKSYEKEIQKIDISLSRYKTSKVYAEKDGYVVRIWKNDKNQYIKKGEKIVLFSPKVKERAVLLKVNSFDMPLVKKGLPVRIQFYGWPTLQISGWPKIKFGTFGGVIDKIDPISHEKDIFYAYVVESPEEPWPDVEQLKIGTQATGWVRLSTVPIWYEIWRKVNAFPPKMVIPAYGEK